MSDISSGPIDPSVIYDQENHMTTAIWNDDHDRKKVQDFWLTLKLGQ